MTSNLPKSILDMAQMAARPSDTAAKGMMMIEVGLQGSAKSVKTCQTSEGRETHK